MFSDATLSDINVVLCYILSHTNRLIYRGILIVRMKSVNCPKEDSPVNKVFFVFNWILHFLLFTRLEHRGTHTVETELYSGRYYNQSRSP
jgi:hypothetical protein